MKIENKDFSLFPKIVVRCIHDIWAPLTIKRFDKTAPLFQNDFAFYFTSAFPILFLKAWEIHW